VYKKDKRFLPLYMVGLQKSPSAAFAASFSYLLSGFYLGIPIAEDDTKAKKGPLLSDAVTFFCAHGFSANASGNGGWRAAEECAFRGTCP